MPCFDGYRKSHEVFEDIERFLKEWDALLRITVGISAAQKMPGDCPIDKLSDNVDKKNK